MSAGDAIAVAVVAVLCSTILAITVQEVIEWLARRRWHSRRKPWWK